MQVDEFKRDCITSSPGIIVQRIIIDSPTYFFTEIEPGKEFDFKKDIAAILDVHIRDIVIVGSGKLGFSLKPDESNAGLYLFKEFDYQHKIESSIEKSDLDVAIISSFLFDKEIKNLYDHTGYYKSNVWKDRTNFAKYILKGRFAIRLLPEDFSLTKEVFLVQEKYQMNYGRKVNIEIYKSWHFFETYHEENIRNIQINLIR